MAAGSGRQDGGNRRQDGGGETAQPALKIISYILFALVVVIIIVGVLWAAQHFIYTSFGLDIFQNGGEG